MAGNAAVVFTETNATEFPSAAYATLPAGAGNFGPPVVAATGTGPYFKKSTGWGDYSFAVPGASDSAWLATEYIPPKSSQTTDGQQNWGDARHPGPARRLTAGARWHIWLPAARRGEPDDRPAGAARGQPVFA